MHTCIRTETKKSAASWLAVCLLAVSGIASAGCPLGLGQLAHPGDTKTIVAPITGLAFATYYVTVGQTGGDVVLFNLSATPAPGFSQSNVQKGFIGSATNVYISYFVPPTVQPPRSRTVTLRVLSSVGATVCTTNYDIYVGP